MDQRHLQFSKQDPWHPSFQTRTTDTTSFITQIDACQKLLTAQPVSFLGVHSLSLKESSIYDVHKKIRVLSPPSYSPHVVDMKHTTILKHNDVPGIKLKCEHLLSMR